MIFVRHLSFLCALLLPFTSAKSLNVSVYYETNCIYSRKFFNEQLEPIYSKISDDVDFQFVPFGNAESSLTPSGEVEFKCQHGVQECESNKFQSCALHLHPSPDAQAKIVFCAMRPRKLRVEDCIEELGLWGDEIQRCMKGMLGTVLQLQAEKVTARVLEKIPGVPTVVFNQKINETEATLSLDEFAKLVAWKLRNVTKS